MHVSLEDKNSLYAGGDGQKGIEELYQVIIIISIAMSDQ